MEEAKMFLKYNKDKNDVFFFSKKDCIFCQKLEKDLTRYGIRFRKIELLDVMKGNMCKLINWYTFPMLFIADEFIGGYTQFKEMVDGSKLLDFLAKKGIEYDAF